LAGPAAARIAYALSGVPESRHCASGSEAKADGSPLTAAASVAGPPQTFTVINNEDGS
jgi:hypothetical protein